MRGVFVSDEDFPPWRLQASLVSLWLGHARGKTTLSCFLTLSRRFATRSTAQMRTPFCNILLHRWALVLSFYEIKINTIHEGWCSFIWRRKRDSILARTTRSVFLGRGRPQEVRSTPIPLRIPPQQEKSLNQTTRVQFRLLLAQEEGFEPPWLWA